jgi:hypothetical protein
MLSCYRYIVVNAFGLYNSVNSRTSLYVPRSRSVYRTTQLSDFETCTLRGDATRHSKNTWNWLEFRGCNSILHAVSPESKRTTPFRSRLEWVTWFSGRRLSIGRWYATIVYQAHSDVWCDDVDKYRTTDCLHWPSECEYISQICSRFVEALRPKILICISRELRGQL